MDRPPIQPLAPRWQPNPDPESIQVPGLDTNASTYEQIDQIEQLITIKLQNIDENFSKIHSVLQNRILPSVKRYSVATEPVREAAKFWTSFYEQAAQIRIPTADDYSTVNEQLSERVEDSTQDQTHDSSQIHESGTTDTTATQDQYSPTEDRFNLQESQQQPSSHFHPADMTGATDDSSFAHGAVSSTPATARMGQLSESFDTDRSFQPSFAESPLDKLSRDVRSFSMEEDMTFESVHPRPDETLRSTTASNRLDRTVTQSANKTKKKEETPLRSVLKRNLYSAQDVSNVGAVALSPNKSRIPVPTPNKSRNPYLPPNTRPSEWSGVVDLRDPNVLSPKKKGKGRDASPVKEAAFEEDDSWEGLPPGMSPPRFMSPARPPRSAAELGLKSLGRTPLKDVASRITRDAVSSLQKNKPTPSVLRSPMRSGYSRQIESSSSTIPSPPSMSKYHQYSSDPSGISSLNYNDTIDAMLQRMQGLVDAHAAPSGAATPGFQFNVTKASTASSGQPSGSTHSPSVPRSYPRSQPNLITPGQEPLAQDSPANSSGGGDHFKYQTPGGYAYDEEDSDLYEDELEFNTAHPSAAFLMASQRKPGINDDSLSSEEDSLDAEQHDLDPGELHPHPFARIGASGGTADDSWDDSFDDDAAGGGPPQEPSETLFGIREGQQRQDQLQDQALRLFGQGNLGQDSDDFTGHSVASPTPAGGGGAAGLRGKFGDLGSR